MKWRPKIWARAPFGALTKFIGKPLLFILDTMRILGSDTLTVTLAMSSIEDIISHHGDTAQNGAAAQKSPSAGLASMRSVYI